MIIDRFDRENTGVLIGLASWLLLIVVLGVSARTLWRRRP
jgi:hypothetical protein